MRIIRYSSYCKNLGMQREEGKWVNALLLSLRCLRGLLNASTTFLHYQLFSNYSENLQPCSLLIKSKLIKNI